MTSRTRKPAPATPRGRKPPSAMIPGGLFTVLPIVTIFPTLDGGRAAADEYGDPLITGGSATLDGAAIALSGS